MTIRVSITDAVRRLAELTQRVKGGETVVITEGDTPVADLVPHHEKKGLDLGAGEKFLRDRGIREIFPYVADDFDDPLPEDFLVRPLP